MLGNLDITKSWDYVAGLFHDIFHQLQKLVHPITVEGDDCGEYLLLSFVSSSLCVYIDRFIKRETGLVGGFNHLEKY